MKKLAANGVMMIKFIKEYLFLWKQYRKQKRICSAIDNAQKHALLSLAYWKDCEKECGLLFQIEKSNIYVRLGKGKVIDDQ
jgi:hypothetical protein